jgi:phage baseplate assembly protein W
MASIGPRLPLTLDSGDGYSSLKTLKATIKQNFKMLILTNPGERVMEPNFGVGIRQFLFQSFSDNIYAEIDVRIREQAATYLPVIRIDNLEFGTNGIDDNSLAIRIEFSIPDIASRDLLEFTI